MLQTDDKMVNLWTSAKVHIPAVFHLEPIPASADRLHDIAIPKILNRAANVCFGYAVSHPTVRIPTIFQPAPANMGLGPSCILVCFF